MTEQSARHPNLVRDILRKQTRVAHEELHHHSSFVALFKQTLSLDEYKALMQGFYGFYAPLDHAIQSAISQSGVVQGEYAYESRAIHLEADLIDLGFSSSQIKAMPHCQKVLDIVSPATLGGVLYVVEGSTLGAAPIDRAAQKLLDAHQPNGRQFWAWCRAGNGQRWAATNSYLETLDVQDTSLDALAKGACDTFEALADWLEPLNTARATALEAYA